MSASKHRLYFLLQTTAHRLKKQADTALLAEGSLTTAQAAVMGVIASQGPVSQRHVAGVLSLRESAMTPMVARLVNGGFISKARSTVDQRAWQLELTEQGAAALHTVQASFAKVNAVIDEELGLEGVEGVAHALKKILSAMDA